MPDTAYRFSPFDFGEILRTKDEATMFLDLLDKIVDSIYNAKQAPTQKMKELLPYQMYQYLTRQLAKQGVSPDDKETLKGFLSQMQMFVRNIPVVTIELAFWPTESMLGNMSNFLSIYLKKTILFDIVVNRDVIAGCKLNYNGKYKDLSFKNKIDETIRHEAHELTINL